MPEALGDSTSWPTQVNWQELTPLEPGVSRPREGRHFNGPARRVQYETPRKALGGRIHMLEQTGLLFPFVEQLQISGHSQGP